MKPFEVINYHRQSVCGLFFCNIGAKFGSTSRKKLLALEELSLKTNALIHKNVTISGKQTKCSQTRLHKHVLSLTNA